MIFSVITVTWNNLEGLKSTCESLHAQHPSLWEWIIIDGNSNDGTKEWLAGIKQENCKWISEPDKGIFDAMNKGIIKSSGDYLLFMNAGDVFFDSNTLHEVAKAIEEYATRPVFIYGDAIDIRADGKEYLKRAKSHENLYKTMFTSHQAMFFERQFGEEHQIRYPLEYRITGDYAFISLYFSYIHEMKKVLYLGVPICRFMLGGTNEVMRYGALKEDFVIRRKIIGLGFIQAGGLYILHFIHTLVKRIFPALAKAMRYKKPK